MIQAALQVADRLAALHAKAGGHDEALFTVFIDPMYRDAECVLYDYTSLHLDLETRDQEWSVNHYTIAATCC